MISVIIPLYNRAHLISYTLQSLAEENHPDVNLEIIVVDDGSADGGPELVRNNFSSVKLIMNEINLGAAVSRNIGTQYANGDFVHFLDSDDIVEKGFYLRKINSLYANKKLSGVYGPWDYFKSEHNFRDENIQPRKKPYPLYDSFKNKIIITNILSGWFIHPAAIIWRISSVKEIGGYNADLIVNQDVDFLFRMILNNEIVGIESPRALIRIHKGERVGQIRSENKLVQILNLRIQFIETLEGLKMLTPDHKKAVAQYTFDLWQTYRKSYPQISKKLLDFSKKNNPFLRLRGTWPLRLLGYLVGAANAIRIKDLIKSHIS
jgi:glycosyltransferase involved in cell wall biosynthesis